MVVGHQVAPFPLATTRARSFVTAMCLVKSGNDQEKVAIGNLGVTRVLRALSPALPTGPAESGTPILLAGHRETHRPHVLRAVTRHTSHGGLPPSCLPPFVHTRWCALFLHSYTGPPQELPQRSPPTKGLLLAVHHHHPCCPPSTFIIYSILFVHQKYKNGNAFLGNFG